MKFPSNYWINNHLLQIILIVLITMIMAIIITILTSRIYCQDKMQDLVGIIYTDLEILPWNLANEHFRKLLNAFKI